MFSFRRLLLYSLAISIIAACGFKGPLYMPKTGPSSPQPATKTNKYAPSAPLKNNSPESANAN